MIDALRPSVAANYIPSHVIAPVRRSFGGSPPTADEAISRKQLISGDRHVVPPSFVVRQAHDEIGMIGTPRDDQLRSFFLPLRRFATNAFQNSVRLPVAFPDETGVEKTIETEVSILSRPKLASLSPVALTDKEDIGVIKKILPSVVRMYAENTKNDSAWYGSGVIVNPSDIIPGYKPKPDEYFILTNHHVANEADFLSAKLADGTEVMGKVVTSPDGAKLMDKEMDVALVRIYSKKPLPTARIGDPTLLEIGQKTFTAGHPKALPNVAVTKGIISNPAQETGSLSLDIQSDAPINPGNSGGPSFNEDGEVIGMNTYTFKNSEDLTFAKPIDVQIGTLSKIWASGELVRGALNFTVMPFPLIDRIQAGFPENITGAIVDTVTAGSEAEKAGLKSGDIISWLEVREDGSAIKNLDVNILDYFEANGIIKRWAANLAPGTEIHALTFRKNGLVWDTLDLPMTVEELE